LTSHWPTDAPDVITDYSRGRVLQKIHLIAKPSFPLIGKITCPFKRSVPSKGPFDRPTAKNPRSIVRKHLSLRDASENHLSLQSIARITCPFNRSLQSSARPVEHHLSLQSSGRTSPVPSIVRSLQSSARPVEHHLSLQSSDRPVEHHLSLQSSVPSIVRPRCSWINVSTLMKAD